MGTVPITGAYNQRDFQTFKTVSDSNPEGGESVTYTITIINKSDDQTSLTEIRDTLPAGFTYDCEGPTNQLTLPGLAPQDIFPGIPCPSGSSITWGMPPSTSIQPGEVTTLTFTAVTADNPGTYCNEAQVVPGADKTSSGQTAIVEIETSGGLCLGEAVLVSHTMDSADLVWSDLTAIAYTYALEVDYTIKVENIGNEDLELSGFIDLLPVGYSYFANIPGGTITDAPFNLHYVSNLDRQRVTWKFNPAIPMAPGTTQTLQFKADSVGGQGNYWVDLLVEFGNGSFSEKVYTWPTALVSITDVYDVTAVGPDRDVVIDLQVLI